MLTCKVTNSQGKFNACIVGDYNLASQKGMSLGAVRHGADIKAEDTDPKSQGILNIQTGKSSSCDFSKNEK